MCACLKIHYQLLRTEEVEPAFQYGEVGIAGNAMTPERV